MLLTAIVIFCGAFASWTVTNRAKEFYILLLLLVSGVFGVFVSQDLFFFFLFYEIAVLPMYLLIGIWGTGPKEYSAMKLTLYLLVGSAFMLVGMLGMYFTAKSPGGMPLHTFDLVALSARHLRGDLPARRLLPALHRLRHPRRHLAAAHLVAGRSRLRAHRGVHAPRRRADEAGGLRAAARRLRRACRSARTTGPGWWAGSR